jgi:hypothetical protein
MPTLHIMDFHVIQKCLKEFVYKIGRQTLVICTYQYQVEYC